MDETHARTHTERGEETHVPRGTVVHARAFLFATPARLLILCNTRGCAAWKAKHQGNQPREEKISSGEGSKQATLRWSVCSSACCRLLLLFAAADCWQVCLPVNIWTRGCQVWRGYRRLAVHSSLDSRRCLSSEVQTVSTFVQPSPLIRHLWSRDRA